MSENVKSIFEYAVSGVCVKPTTKNVHYVVYNDGLIEKQELDRLEENIISRKKYGKSEQAVITITDFYNSHKDIIESLPDEFDNLGVLDGSYVHIKFFNKSISGFNIIYPAFEQDANFNNIENFIKLLKDFLETIKKYPCFNILTKVISKDLTE